MNVQINGTDHDVADAVTVAALIEQFAGSTRGTAVVLDGEVVPRSQWPDVAVRAGQRIELITAVQGG